MIKDELFVTAFIADIHFGAQKAETLYTELINRFVKKIDNKKIDMIVFGGDLFHSIISMNYSTSKFVLLFMEQVIDICVRNGIKYIRILQGTMSHDNNQLINFRIYENREDVDFKIILTVTEETLSEGLRILYVPEEYITDMDSYYAPYLKNAKKKYDFIFGHGMFKEVAFIAKNQKSEVTMSKAPIFDSKIFINACKGPIYFGHIHIKTTIRNHIYYPGSYSRFRFGEEEPKGWYLSIYDTKTHKYVHEFIENKNAPLYTTIRITIHEDTKPESLEPIISKALQYNDYVRLQLIIEDNKIDASYVVNYLTELYRDNKAVKFDIKNEYEFKQEAAMQNLMDQVWDKYNFLKDSGVSHEEKIQRFIKEKHQKDIPLDVIRDVLNLSIKG
jgi:DNA repair exonuclease SbcCD nuclease subunit